MMGSTKEHELLTLRQHRIGYHAQEQVSAFENLPQQVKSDLRNQLHREQRGLCVYCGQALDLSRNQEFHIEHFKPQSSFGEQACEHSNLFLSCGPNTENARVDWCGAKKADWFVLGLVVDPIHPHCTDRFKFRTRGKIVPALPGDLAAQEMIDRLNLNHKEIVRERRTLMKQIDANKVDSPWKDQANRVAISYGHIAARRLGIAL